MADYTNDDRRNDILFLQETCDLRAVRIQFLEAQLIQHKGVIARQELVITRILEKLRDKCLGRSRRV